MGAQGSATIDFGAFPGKSDAATTVSAVGIADADLAEAWIRPVASADHSADEHLVETIRFHAIAVGGFAVIAVQAFNTGSGNTRIYGVWNFNWVWNA